MASNIRKELQIVLKVNTEGAQNLKQLKNDLKSLSADRSKDSNTNINYRTSGLDKAKSDLTKTSSASKQLATQIQKARSAMDDYVEGTQRADQSLGKLANRKKQLQDLRRFTEGATTTSRGKIAASSFKGEDLKTTVKKRFGEVPPSIQKSLLQREKQSVILTKVEKALREVADQEIRLARATELGEQESLQRINTEQKRVKQLHNLAAEEYQLQRARTAAALGYNTYTLPQDKDLNVEEVQAALAAQRHAKHAASVQQTTAGASTTAAASAQAALNRQLEQTSGVGTSAASGLNRVEREAKDLSTAAKSVSTSMSQMGDSIKKSGQSGEVAEKELRGYRKGFASLRELIGKRGGLAGELIFSTGRLGFYALAATLIYNVAAAFRQAFAESFKFQKILQDIQGVLPSKSIIGRDMIADIAVQNAQKFGLALTETAEAAKTFAQTGRTASQISRDLGAAFLAVRGANLNLEQAKDLVIAIENITSGELEAIEVLDRISRVESTRAVTANDLAVAFQRLGPLVRQLKGDTAGLVDEFDIALGAVTTIVERTRVSGTNAATSLRFILSRLGRPEIVKQLQSLTGVKLSRSNGRELRPYQEILEEISITYRNLLDQQKSGKAFEILSVLGGARQLQATATLLEDFGGTTLKTARESALAFNDANERTDIGLQSIVTQAGRAKTAFNVLVDSQLRHPLNVAILNAGLKSATRLLSRLTDGLDNANDRMVKLLRFIGIDIANKYQFTPVDLSDIRTEDYSKLQRIASISADAGQSTNEFLAELQEYIYTATKSFPEQFGGSLQDLLAITQDDSLTDSLRGIREAFGAQLADNLALTTDKFADYKNRIEETTDANVKAKIESERIAEAYNVLGAAVFATTGRMEINNRRLQQQLQSAGESTVLSVQRALSEIEEVEGSGNYPLIIQALSDDARAFVKIMEGMRNTTFLDKFDAYLKPIVATMFEGERAANAFADAVESVRIAGDFQTSGQALLQTLDEFATKFLVLGDVRPGIVSTMSDAFTQLVDSQGLASANNANLQKDGQQFAQVVSSIIEEAILSSKELNLTNKEIQTVMARVIELMQAGETANAAFLEQARIGFVRVKQELFNLVTGFIEAASQADKLRDAFGQIGVGYNATEAKFAAGKTLLQGIVGLRTKLSVEAAEAFQQMTNFTGNIAEQAAAEGTLTNETLEALSKSAENVLTALPQRAQTSVATLRHEYEALSTQVKQLDSVSLDNLLGTSPEGKFLLETLQTLFKDADISALSDAEIFGNLSIFRTAASAYTEAMREAVLQDNLSLQAAKQRVSLVQKETELRVSQQEFRGETALNAEKSRAKIAEDIARINEQSTVSTRVQIENSTRATQLQIDQARNLADVRRQGVGSDIAVRTQELQEQYRISKDQNALEKGLNDLQFERTQKLGDINEEERKRIAELKQQLTTGNNELIAGNIVQTYGDLSKQIQANIDSATSGLKSALTSYENFNASGGLRNVLSPISDTFLSRTADNFINALFSTTQDSLLGGIASAFASGPESELKKNLELALSLGADDIARKQAIVFNDFLAKLSTIMGVEKPEGIEVSSTRQPAGGTSTKLLTQFGTLAASLAVSQIAASTGRNPQNANIGAGIGAGIAQGIFQGSAFAGPIGAVVGGLLGGIIGGRKKDEQEEKKIQALKKIQYNTDRSANVLELERQFIDVARGAVNVPTAFNLPSYAPGVSGGQISQSNEIRLDINIHNPVNGEEVIQTITSELGPRLTDELRNLGL